MDWIVKLITGGFLAGYRTKILSVLLIIDAIGKFAVGDLGLQELIAQLPQLIVGLGLMTAAVHKPKE